MHQLMAAVILWLAANFDLPPTEHYPTVRFVSPAELAVLRYRSLAAASHGTMSYLSTKTRLRRSYCAPAGMQATSLISPPWSTNWRTICRAKRNSDTCARRLERNWPSKHKSNGSVFLVATSRSRSGLTPSA